MAEAIAEALAQLATEADLAALATAIKADLSALETRIDSKLEILKRDMTIWLDSMMAVAVGVILAGFKIIH